MTDRSVIDASKDFTLQIQKENVSTMRTRTTSQYRAELKERIILSAIENFARSGFDKTRMEDIASSSGLAKGTLYLYFKSKEDLFFALCEHNLEQLRNQLSKLFSKKENIMSDAEGFYNEYHRVSLGDDTIWFEMIALSTRNPKLRKILVEYHSKVYQAVKEFLKIQIERGFFRKDIDIDAIAGGLVALYNGLATNKLLLQTNDFDSQKVWIETIRAIIGAAAVKQ
jgi:TetR/AcrR family transcriptional repressor of uid operon